MLCKRLCAIRASSLFILVFFSTGCLPSQIIPTRDIATRIRTIEIIAIESQPLEIVGDMSGGLYGIEGLSGLSGAYGSGAGALVVLYGVVALIRLPSEANISKSNYEKINAMVSDNNAWVPTMALANKAAEILKSCGKYNMVSRTGVVELPGIKNRASTFFMESWMAPLRSWYKANPSLLHYGNKHGVMADAILEVGMLNYSIYRENLIIQIALKLVDPKTGEILGRTKSIAMVPVGKPKDLFKDGAELFKNAFRDAGSNLLMESLSDISLCPLKAQ